MIEYRKSFDDYLINGVECQLLVNFTFEPEDREAGSDLYYDIISISINGGKEQKPSKSMERDLIDRLEIVRSEVKEMRKAMRENFQS